MKSWEFANPTSVTWPEGSKLIFVEGSRDLLSATEEFEVPRAAPGQTIEAKCPIQVPSKPGKYVATFQLATKDREPFEGHRCWVELVVAEEEPKPVPISIPEPKAEELSKPQTQPKTESKPVEALPIEQPKEELKIVAQKPVEEPKPVEQKLSKQDQALQEKYNSQLGVLESMGFTNAQLNLYLIQNHKGNVEQTVSWLLEMEKTR
jgi:outer membrane biosynthesis protein TonB